MKMLTASTQGLLLTTGSKAHKTVEKGQQPEAQDFTQRNRKSCAHHTAISQLSVMETLKQEVPWLNYAASLNYAANKARLQTRG